jgi:uncharacterized membrane protein (UPF0182 family)
VATRTRGPALPGRPRLFAPVAIVVVLLLILGGVFVSQYTDLLWFRETGYSQVFSTVLKTKIALFFGGGLFMALIVGANIYAAYRVRPPFRPMSLEQQNLERYRVAIEPFLLPVLLLISGVFGLFAGLSAAGRWRTWLLWAHGQSFGTTDAQFHKDISYFTFTYPFLRFLLGFFLVTLVLSLIAAAVTHYLFGGVRLQTAGEKISVAARVHLSVLIGFVVLGKAASYWLDRYGLAFSDRGFVQGPGYTDVHAVLPAKTMLFGIAIICAVLFFVNIVVRNVLLPAGALGLLVVSAIVVGGIYPAVVQRFQVAPNASVRESTYIQRNIDATRSAYQIDKTAVTQYPAPVALTPAVSTETKNALRDDTGTIPNARLLDPNKLGPTFKAQQGIRNYFGFGGGLDIDRYTIAGKTQDYIVAARGLEQSSLSSGQQNWINLHLSYTHGNGVVAAPANSTDGGLPAFVVKNVPPAGADGLTTSVPEAFALDHPQVYYGETSPNYSIVDTKQGEIDGPGTDKTEQSTVHYGGPGGVKLDSGFRKLLYALKFKEKNVLLSSSLTKDSKIMYIRSPKERVAKLAPFLELDSDPYPAVIDGQLLWIVDGYTTSSGYPYSERVEFGKATTDSRTNNTTTNSVNYIRNSVKATVDAYTGKVTLYTWDEQDPVLKTWKAIFPKLIQPKSAITASLAAHLRYPEDYFKVQRELLTRYHVTDPAVFYGGEDFWQIPADPTEDAQQVLNSSTTAASPAGTAQTTNSGPAQPPYYVVLQVPGEKKPQFSLTSTFVARNSTNLTAFASVSSDPEDYGVIRILQLPKGAVVAGPGQVANNFESNPDVSKALTLLRQGGSQVVLGNLLTLPVGKGLLYIEPVYTQGKADSSYPILSSVIVSFGGQIAYQPTFAGALTQLFGPGAGVKAVDGGGSPSPAPSGTPPSGTPATQTIAQLVAVATQAYADGQAALKSGDFAAYGQAQTQLKVALDKLAASASPSPSATPRPSATPKP